MSAEQVVKSMIVPWRISKSGERFFVNNGVYGYFVDHQNEADYLLKLLRQYRP